MKLKTNIIISLLLILCSYSYGQLDQYNYKRELKGVENQWHKVVLHDEIFGKISPGLSDIRIFGITDNHDTIEAPYLIHLTTEERSSNDMSFSIINKSHNNKGYYFTFEMPTVDPVNQIKLDFKQPNFDWRIKLEGSQNQQDWFTIIQDYRILSIKNEMTNYHFTKISFPNSSYRFFRLFIESDEKPDLTAAKVSRYEVTEGTFRIYPVKKTVFDEDKQTKQTEINIELQSLVPVSNIKIAVKDTYDYYRPITIKYLSDSIKTEKGWKYKYSTLTSGTLNSLEENEFQFNSTILQKLKIIIHNSDNQPLTIDNIEVTGVIHEVIARFTEPATYYLVYGNSNARKPHYDINRFADKIPESIITLELGDEQTIDKLDLPYTEPLFKNKIWLWIIMIVIILLLGWFSIKMIRND